MQRKATTMCIVKPLTMCAVAVVATLFSGNGAAQSMTVICESINYRNQVCSVPGGPVSLVRQFSTPPGDCIQGRTWGFDRRNNTVWVNNGCRAEFRVSFASAPWRPGPGMTVICESNNYRDQVCPVPGGRVSIVRQLSRPPGDCIEGQTWGFDRRSNTIWVRSGCRAEFGVR